MTTYRSKFGFETFILLGLLFVALIGFMIYKNDTFKSIMNVGVVFLMLLGLLVYLNLSTRYTISNYGVLQVTCGFLYNKRFDIKKIKSIAKTDTLISSPAPSLDRIELTYGEFGSIVISPRDKQGFAVELLKINPMIDNQLIEHIEDPNILG